MTEPIVEMSQAIRLVVEEYGVLPGSEGLQALRNDVLVDFTQIVEAYALDLRAECDRRKQRPPWAPVRARAGA